MSGTPPLTTEDEFLAYQDADGENRPRTLVTLLGPASVSHESAIQPVARQLIARRRRPVVCASALGRDFIVDGTLAIELLPRRADLPALSSHEYAAYLQRRWDTVLAKWQITEEITLGQSFDAFVADQVAACHPVR